MPLHTLIQTRHPLLGPPTVTVVRAIGALDAAGVDDFAAAVDTAVRLGCPRLVVDLSEVDFLAISGAAALSDARARTTLAGIEMVLVVTSPWVEHTIVVTGVSSYLPRFGTMLQAFDAVDASADPSR
ncbi:STAS domain-containing protein [Rhodococcus sp. NPDC003318]|uniref:STAS domain-containing protein n=1 Tax=Rhodococcus sp. NPDC003318 TaxID=3364503 RepID=UPI00367ED851